VSDTVLELLDVARSIADAIPTGVADEIVVTGSVSRGITDERSDIEMLIVTRELLGLDACYELARGAGLEQLGTWGPQGGPTQRVSGYRDGVPIELIFWSAEFAETAVDALFEGDGAGSGDALAHGVALRTAGALARWQERLRAYPDELALRRIEDAALTWGGFAPEGLLTLTRPGERLALVERLVDDAQRVLKILYAINRIWPPTGKRLNTRANDLTVKPDRLAERIAQALTEPDPDRAEIVMTRLQLDTVALAPDTPNIVRARDWLARGLAILEAR
jgi:predicted nucleotidyltransferase